MKLILGPLLAASLFAQSNADLFTQRLLPVFSRNCAACHMGGNASGGLRLDSLDSTLSGGKHGAAISPGDTKGSLLLQYVRGERSPKMPMGGTLDADIIELLAKSI